MNVGSVNSINALRIGLLKPVSKRMCLGVIAMIIAAAIQLSVPYGTAHFIDKLASGVGMAWVTDIAVYLVMACIIYCAASAFRYYFFESSGNIILANLREQLHKALLDHDISFFDTTNAGELSSRITSDVETLKHSLSMGIVVAIRSAIILLGCLTMMFALSVTLTMIVMLLIPLSLGLGQWLGKKARQKAFTLQDAMAGSLKRAQEDYSNIRVIHAFQKQTFAFSMYRKANQKTLLCANSNTRLFALFQALSTFVTFFTLSTVLVIGATFVSGDTFSLGELASFVIYSGMAASSAMGISGCWGEWMHAYGSTERVFEMIRWAQEKEIKMKAKVRINTLVSAPVKFKNVHFNYPSRPDITALQDFNLVINKGEVVALVGSSGAGKSTVANLLLGLYNIDNGALFFNDQNSQDYELEAIRNSCVLVEQEPSLFSGSIADNILFACKNENTSNVQIIEAAKTANAHNFIMSLPEGYDTEVGERGVQLSGGQKQRIAIARALLRDPEILILDEATSALDSDSESLVEQALSHLMQGRTTIIIAHRLSTIARASRVVVMHEGKIIQEGCHDELSLQLGSHYQKLISAQTRQVA
jgi:ATP-binding cassette subfamily B protein